MKYERNGECGDGYLLLGTPTPLPPGLMKSRAWREFFGVVFESKGLISKYSGIRTYGISCHDLGFIEL
jgi:hypothetical protein